jgi:Skp family chaperone for outer membrane proteins
MILKSLTFGVTAFVLSISGAAAAEIRVTLFGQPCLLQGPASESALRAIHAISPEQIYPTFEPGEKFGAVKSALEKLRSSKDVPPELDNYKDQLGKRLEAQSAFLTGLEDALKAKKAEPLLAKTNSFLSESRQKSLEAIARKLESAQTPTQRSEIVQQLFNSYAESLPADPEEEFHRAIHRMKVQYVCSFEESGEGEDSGD